MFFSDDFREVPGLPFGCFLMTFGHPFRSLFHLFPCLFKSVKYVSGLMYFVVLDPSKSIKNRYIFVMNFMFFRDPPFYWFLIDFGGGWGSKNRAFPSLSRFQKKSANLKAPLDAPGTSRGALQTLQRRIRNATSIFHRFWIDFGSHFGHIWSIPAWYFNGFVIRGAPIPKVFQIDFSTLRHWKLHWKPTKFINGPEINCKTQQLLVFPSPHD